MKPTKFRKTFRIVTEELLANGVGWITGLVAANLVSYFFAARSWKNLWGIASAKMVVDKHTFNILEWLTAALVGYIVLVLVNRVIGKWLLNSIFDNNENEEMQKS